ncbi:HAMP domain-containing histidine kinase [Acidovorax sp. SUPP2522]|uniref:ATP-binding protein n=1 Tax=unclassified Acidovorax TaxID=2684926 RepID=UPI00234AD35E|nr:MULTISPECIES: ATP-binding protein [unclassified Acidovorax]WCM95908.1 ATP-binding protein [Acidovorax sp. GBBC 1281]GKT14495.1 HAMP domain-containing histidine kinase [Acidovorax sp. SUPP2522]
MPLSPDAPAERPAPRTRAAVADSTGLKNLQQLIQLRWIAVIGQLFTIEVVHYSLGIILPLQAMLMVLGALVVFNTASLLRWRIGRRVRNVELFFAMVVDVAMLTAQLYLSGGTTNPFVFLYLLQVTLAAVLLRAGYTWTIVAMTVACLCGLALFSRPLALPLDHDRGLYSPYVLGMLVCFMLNAVLLVIFITRIGRNLRQRDARLATMRQRAAEEDHIVRTGLLASGAAHELGTPLSTLAVILGDWRRMPALAQDAELQAEIAEMQAQVRRCKTIVSGILLSAGETRGEESMQTTVCTFLDQLAEEWRSTRPVGTFAYDNQFGEDRPMVSDVTLQQMVFNVLDNARDASPHWVGLAAEQEAGALLITVTDAGPGFAPAMLEQFGKPYQSSKGRPGGGLGLYLATNVARTLGGTITARNRAAGGAAVTITLPLAAVALQETPDHGR